jgi:hypothetical protein
MSRLILGAVASVAEFERVRDLRAAGQSWAKVAAAVGCKVGAARLAAAR